MKVYIGSGSSKESLAVAEFVSRVVENNDHIPRIWNDTDILVAGVNNLDCLERVAKEVDAAIFVFSDDENGWYREGCLPNERDNILLEYGLFSGLLSKSRVIVYCVGETALPEKLRGLSTIDGNKARNAAESIKQWLSIIENEGRSYIPFNDRYCDAEMLGMFQAFASVYIRRNHFKTLRVFAISSINSVHFFKNIEVDEARILLRSANSNDKAYEYKNHAEIIADALIYWRRLESDKVIHTLKVKGFDYHPDEGFYIFDNFALILGALHYDQTSKLIDFDKKLIVIRNTTSVGRQIIHSFVNKFDKIYENSKEEL